MPSLINSKYIILIFFLVVAIIATFFDDGAFAESNGTLRLVEANVKDYVAYRQIGQLDMAKHELGKVFPKSAAILRLTFLLDKVNPNASKDDLQNERLLDESKQMFAPLTHSRLLLLLIKNYMARVGKLGDVMNEKAIYDVFEMFAEYQPKFVQEAKAHGYAYLEEALAKLGKAIAEFKAEHLPYTVRYGPTNPCKECNQIGELALAAMEVGLRQMFGLCEQ